MDMTKHFSQLTMEELKALEEHYFDYYEYTDLTILQSARLHAIQRTIVKREEKEKQTIS